MLFYAFEWVPPLFEVPKVTPDEFFSSGWLVSFYFHFDIFPPSFFIIN